MSLDIARELSTHLQDVVGDHLRSVLYFDGQDHEVVYIRDDVENHYSNDEVISVVESLIADAVRREQIEDLYVHGHLNCMVRCFNNALELHFPHGDMSGTAVSFDAAAGQDLYDLIADVVQKTSEDASIPKDLLEIESD